MSYDSIADYYQAFVEAGHNDPTAVLGIAKQALLNQLGNVNQQTICDLGCGQGHLIPHLQSAKQIIGIDLSEGLLDIARANNPLEQVTFIQDDAQHLSTQADATFDVVVSNLALMDIPDLQAVYQAVHRILRHGGRFIFSLTHPCFQSPHAQFERREETVYLSLHRYKTEGFWKSTNTSGIRGQVGANHRTLSTYINSLISTGFQLASITEPTIPNAIYEQASVTAQIEIPSVMVISAVKPTE